jgi:hypothetical protein
MAIPTKIRECIYALSSDNLLLEKGLPQLYLAAEALTFSINRLETAGL